MSEISEDVGTKLLFENDRVRVWDLTLPPGESTGKHRLMATLDMVCWQQTREQNGGQAGMQVKIT